MIIKPRFKKDDIVYFLECNTIIKSKIAEEAFQTGKNTFIYLVNGSFDEIEENELFISEDEILQFLKQNIIDYSK